MSGDDWQPGDPLKEIPASIFADDDGQADARLLQAMIRVANRRAPVSEVVDALAYARVLVPVMAQGHERIVGKHGLEQDHVASTGVVALQTPDGRAALPVFTDVAAMAAWSADARPIPAEGPRAALAAIAEDWAVMVINPHAEALVIPRPAVWALGKGEPWRPAVVDGVVAHEVAAAISDAVGGIDHVRGVTAVPGASAEVAVVLGIEPGLDEDRLAGVVAQVRDALAGSAEVAERVDGIELRLTAVGETGRS